MLENHKNSVIETVDDNGSVSMIVLTENGGFGVAGRLREARSLATKHGVPLRIVRHGVCDEFSPVEGPSQHRRPPVNWMNLDQMTEWLQNNYPRGRR